MEENIYQPPSPEVSPPPSSPSPKFPPPLIATFVLLIIIGAVGGFFLGKYLTQPKSTSPITQISPSPIPLSTSTSDPTISWKTYINSEDQYSLKYPSNWYIIKTGGTGAGVVLSNLASEEEIWKNPNDVNQIKVNILVTESATGKSNSTLEEHINTQFGKWSPDKGYETVPFEKTTIQNYEAAKLIKEIAPGRSVLHYIIHKENKFYWISVEPLNSSLMHIFNQILSTFKFLDQPQPPNNETANWKTYRNEKYKFEIKYPPKFLISENHNKNEIIFKDEKWQKREGNYPFLGIFIEETTLSPLEWLNKNQVYGPLIRNSEGKMFINSGTADKQQEQPVKIETINGKEAIRFFWWGVSGGEENILIKNKNFLYRIRRHLSGSLSDPEETVSLEIFNPFLFSFKLLD